MFILVFAMDVITDLLMVEGEDRPRSLPSRCGLAAIAASSASGHSWWQHGRYWGLPALLMIVKQQCP